MIGVFSPALPPLERIHRYCEFEYEEQVKIKREHGHVLGCPLCTLGSEISTLETNLRKLVDEIMDQCRRYFETAIRDAHAAKLIMATGCPLQIQTGLRICGRVVDPGTDSR
ncbi:MAG: hypothetical protein QM813_11975 [Verrucomicrobiota bacterium]